MRTSKRSQYNADASWASILDLQRAPTRRKKEKEEEEEEEEDEEEEEEEEEEEKEKKKTRGTASPLRRR
ncbi:hypothetical protein V1478_015855 [Vespula squamosa]|uniref:Uncharacterized protein n=1 Tax=Vespula squamosa TaxID=30214 RepID=A0ABD2A4E8_VESSQ